MPAYMIFDIDITDQQLWEEYRAKAGPLMAAAGGRFLANDPAAEPLAGDWQPRILSIVEFPDIQTARDFYHSAPYQRMLALRERAAHAKGVLIRSLDPPIAESA